MDVPSCSSCEMVTLPYLESCEPSILQKFREKFFHEPCATCDAEEDQTLQICEVCRHLRLQHLVSCSQSWFASEDRSQVTKALEYIQHAEKKLYGH
ncbi:hypothetical protein EAE99_006044 [Botrytis elliptica]|nr:hypothetical protein EAE99_006044 [Botrytis elliptica]